MSIMKMFDSPKLDSRIQTRNVTGAEKWLGYFLGPAGVIIVNQILNSYLNVYYTDVLGATAWVGGTFMVIFPIVSKIIDAITNLIMANIIDRTRTRQGKLRPFILMSIPLLIISTVLLFAVPKLGMTGQMIWIVLSYNLYYSISYTMYTISQQMLVATATRNSEQRTTVGIFSSVSNFAMGGMFAFAVFPTAIYPMLQKNPDKWLPVMSVFSLIILPLTLIEYFYTRERVTEENEHLEKTDKIGEMSFWQELKLLASNKSWLFLILALFCKELAIKLSNSSVLYYANWVLAPDYTSGGGYFAVINMVGGTVSGFAAMFIVWPLAKKLGKTKLAFLSMIMMGVGLAICWAVPHMWPVVITLWTVMQIGSSLSLYVTPAMLADVVDESEWKFGFRSDALTGAMMSVIMTVSAGLGTGIFNGVLAGCNYQMPELLLRADGSYGAQTPAVQNAIVFMAFGASAIMCVISAFLFSRLKSEKLLPTIQKELMERKKAEAAAEGREWVDPIEAAEAEALKDIEESYQAELDALRKKFSGEKLAAKEAKLQKKYDDKKAKAVKHE